MARRRIKTMSSGVVPIRFSRSGPRVLLLRAWRHWDFPKGGIEAGEQPLEAALREVEEETGITDLTFDWGLDYVDTGPYGNGKVSRYYIARTQTQRVVLGINPELGRPEHHEYRWFSLEMAAPRLTPRVRDVLKWAQECLENSEPGVTPAHSAAPR